MLVRINFTEEESISSYIGVSCLDAPLRDSSLAAEIFSADSVAGTISICLAQTRAMQETTYQAMQTMKHIEPKEAKVPLVRQASSSAKL